MLQTTINPFHLNSSQPAPERRFHAVILIFLAGLLFGATPGMVKAQEPNGAVPPNDLKVMTWNIDGGGCGTDRNMAPFAQVIRAHSPDVVAIQEIHRDQASRLARATGFPQPYFVATKDCRRGADFGLAIMSRYAFEAGSEKVYSFFVFNHPLDTLRGEYRKMIGVNIRVGNQLIRIYNTHLTAIGRSSRPNYFREQQVRLILRSIRADERPSAPSIWPILMGDFNSQPGTPPYALIQPMFEDANPHHDTTSEGTRVDYIFLRRLTGLELIAAGVLATGDLSDHFPVVARYSFNLMND